MFFTLDTTAALWGHLFYLILGCSSAVDRHSNHGYFVWPLCNPSGSPTFSNQYKWSTCVHSMNIFLVQTELHCIHLWGLLSSTEEDTSVTVMQKNTFLTSFRAINKVSNLSDHILQHQASSEGLQHCFSTKPHSLAYVATWHSQLKVMRVLSCRRFIFQTRKQATQKTL